MRLRFLLLAAALVAGGCLPVELPPPAPLPPVEPAIAISPAPPPEHHGRVVVDSDVEGAMVARVSSVTVAALERTTSARVPVNIRYEDFLCIAPCAVDLREGPHTLVFTSPVDRARKSSADVVVTPKTTFVRHAVGRHSYERGSYGGGAVILLLGAMLVAGGGIAFTDGLVDAAHGEPSRALLPGGIVLGLGLAVGAAGILHMSAHQPIDQPGATTQWTR